MLTLFPAAASPKPGPRARSTVSGWGGDNLTIRRNREYVVVEASDGHRTVMLLLSTDQARQAAGAITDAAEQVS